MKFAVAVNLQRLDPGEDPRAIASAALDLVKLAEQGGFEVAFAAEHHTIELVAAPNPFTLLTHWGAHTSTIRLGTATVVAPYWHPIRLAGEAALCDLLIDGRLELGIARGAFQYEFDRMAGGIQQRGGVAYMKEMLPIVRALWAGDLEYEGTLWRFPKSTSVPKPMQAGGPPIWAAVRDPDSFDWAFKNGCKIMTTPLSRPMSEVFVIRDKFEAACRNNPTVPRPRHMLLRQAYVYENGDDWMVPINATIDHARRFENLFQTDGVVENGFTRAVDIGRLSNADHFTPKAIQDSMIFGTPDEVIEKLKVYQGIGVDLLCLGVTFGLDGRRIARSLELFIEKVMPAFAEQPARSPAEALA